ncbi:hypothetical protein [Prosthecomicrobium sp. N25]|uniref:hypothetical protein n=1 Tax=Prosthecomicrobium sp. N25 TaxID=3129254 RepID=UPI00307704F4
MLIAAAAVLVPVLGFLMLIAPPSLRCLALVAVVTVVVGLGEYYLDNRAILWLSFLSAAGFGALGLLDILGSRGLRRGDIPACFFLYGLFVVYLVVVSLANFNGAGGLAVGLKIYVPMFLATFAFIAVGSAERLIAGAERFFLALPFLQFPFAAHQHFFVAPTRGVSSFDAIVGTFGGNMNGGGSNASLMLASIISILVAIDLFRRGRLGAASLGLVCGVATANILLGEVKAVFLFLPVLLVLANQRLILKNPLLLPMLALPVLLFSAIGMAVYENSYWSQNDQYFTREGTRLEQFLGYFFEDDYINYDTGEVSRGASLAVWWSSATKDPVVMLLGNGAGSTRADSTIANGRTAALFEGIDVASTMLTQLLWDSGVIGAALFLAFLAAIPAALYRLAGQKANADLGGSLMTFYAVGLYPLLSCIYNRYFTDRPSEQLLVAFLMALVFLTSLPSRARRRVPAAVPVASLLRA